MKKAIVLLCALAFVLATASPAVCELMHPREFEKRINAFTEQVTSGKDHDYIETKRALLTDLYQTDYSDDFEKKFNAVARYNRATGFDVEKRLAAAKSAKEFEQVKKAYAEWDDFCVMVDRAYEDYAKGFIQELLLDKERDRVIPFEVRSAGWKMNNPSSTQIDAYLKALAQAEKVVAKGISALEADSEDRFAVIFDERRQLLRRAEPERSEIQRIFNRERNEYWKENMSTALAPQFLRADLEEAAKLYNDKGIVKVVVRRWKGDNASFAEIMMAKEGNNYVIDSWAKKFDMQNRRL